MKIFIFGIVLQILSRASATLKVFLKRLLLRIGVNCCFDKGVTNEYYDTLGLERPDGSENEGQMFEFGAVTFSFVKKER